MSIQCSVDCLECLSAAPDVGDGGYLGAPTLEVIEECDEGGGDMMPSFGYLYEPLSLLGIRRYDLEAFRDFLAQHQGHRLYLSGDAEDDLPAELLAMEQDEEVCSRRRDERGKADQLRLACIASGEFVIARYELACTTCGDPYASAEPELLRAAETLAVPRTAVDLFLQRWGTRYPDDGWNHRLYGIVDPYEPFIEGLPEFLKAHIDHRLQAQLRR